MAAEVLYFEYTRMISSPALDDPLIERTYPEDVLNEKDRAAPGGYFCYMVPRIGGRTYGSFVRIAFAQPCSQEERLDAARALLHLYLLQRSYA
jgi:hypothetical protein